MKNKILAVIIIALAFSCKQKEAEIIDASAIVNKAIEVSGGDKIGTSTIAFNFRDKHYKATRNNGIFKYERFIKDSTSTIKDVLSNDGFKRYLNEELVVVADSMIPRYTASVNSVHYFSVLPFGLNDAAVNKEYLGEVTINDKMYHKIKVFFNQDGGGEDFEDVFIYWINKENYKVDFLAYSYEEADGLGLRFREAFNERYVNGIRFVDYNNYKSEKEITDLLSLDKLFENQQLKLLSKIENKDVVVN